MRKREEINQLYNSSIKTLKQSLDHIIRMIKNDIGDWKLNQETYDLIIRKTIDVEESGDLIAEAHDEPTLQDMEIYYKENHTVNEWGKWEKNES